MLAVALDALVSNFTAAFPACFAQACVLFGLLSFPNPVLTEMKQLQGKLQQSKRVRLSSSLSRLTVSLADTLLSAEVSHSVNALTANQLVPVSPVAKKCSTDQPIRTENIKSVTEWANRTGAIGFHQC